jgi:hypothetical protein
MMLRQFRHNLTHVGFQHFIMINKFKKSYNVGKELEIITVNNSKI